MTIDFIALRHGPTAWNAAKKIQGHSDIPLSPEGRLTVEGWQLPPFTKDWPCVASPLKRAQETARLLGKDPRIVPALIEMNWGAWEGQKLTELRQRYGQKMRDNEARGLDFAAEGGETKQDVRNRVEAWLHSDSCPKEPFIMVVHKGILHVLYSLATGWDMTQKPAEKMKDSHCHHFQLTAQGNLEVRQLNIALKFEDKT